MSAASYSGFILWVWKKVSGFDYDNYWKMREYVINNRGDIRLVLFISDKED